MKICASGIVTSIFIIGLLLSLALAAPHDFFTRDPAAVYDASFPGGAMVLEIPGYKLDPASALDIPIGEDEYALAQRLDAPVIEKAEQYIRYSGINKSADHQLYAAKDLGRYILLYFNEPGIMDGGFELIYSKELQKIIGSFVAGYRG